MVYDNLAIECQKQIFSEVDSLQEKVNTIIFIIREWELDCFRIDDVMKRYMMYDNWYLILIMIHYVMLCNVMLCYDMLYYVILCYVMLYYVM